MKTTWARKCSAFVAFSTLTNESIPSIDIPHLGSESYFNMWQKSISIWKYIHRHYLDEFDYFLLGGDDMYYIMENLYMFLLTNEDVQRAERLQEGMTCPMVLVLQNCLLFFHGCRFVYWKAVSTSSYAKHAV
jgi:glycoprotein-N-acetylgalactosamine 3-beta-galactosyltransferase